MAVFPESMDRLEAGNTEKSFQILDHYIRYMAERMEFSMKNMGRVVGETGTSTAEAALALLELRNDLSTLQSALNQLLGDLNGVKGQLASLGQTVSGLQTGVAALTARVEALEAGKGET